MKKLFAAFTNAPKRTAGLLMLAAAVIVPTVLWAWGPDRPLYTIENAAPHVTFNSITNHQDIRDETNFVRIREAVSGTNFRDDVQLQAGKTYEVMVFYHNNAKQELNDVIGEDGHPVGVARNTKARVQMPGRLAAGETATITGFISADNAKPAEVWDNARATTDSAVALRIVPGSAKIASSNGAVKGQTLPNEFFTTGTPLGFDKLDGVLPGCNKYSGYITFQFVVDKPDFTIDKQVSVDGGKTWVESAKTTPGSTVQYRLIYKNTGTVQQNNVILKDELPAGVTYVPGSSQIANATTGGAYKATVDGITGSGGYKIGSFTPGSNNYFKFSAKVGANSTLAKCGDNKLTNKVITYTENGSKSDTADVTVAKDCPPEPPKPKYTCDSLTVKKLERTKFEFNTTYTVENATFKNVTYVVRNASGSEIYRGTNNVYTQTTPGTYTVQAIVTVTVNGVDKTVTSDKCKATFKVDQPPAVPKYTCDSLTVKKLERTKFEFTTKYTVENATFKNVTYVVKNAAGTEVYRGQNNTFTTQTVGKYTVESFVTVTVNGVDKTVTSAACKGTFEVTEKPIEAKPGISIDKKVDGVEHKKVTVNQEFTYQIVVRNTGNVALKNVKVTDDAPAHVQFISADKGAINNNKWSYVIPELKVGASASFAIKAKVTTEVEGIIKNTACVDATEITGTPDDCDDATVEVPTTTPPVDTDMKVCDIETKTIITIKKSEFDENKHTEDLSKCAEAPTPEVPTELPTTGLSEGIMAFVGLGSLVASLGYYISSRRTLGA